MKTAKPRKLRDGSWGAAVQDTVEVGEVIEINTSTGKSWDARVTRIVASGTGDGGTWSLVATEGLDRNTSTSRQVTPKESTHNEETGEMPFCDSEDDIPF